MTEQKYSHKREHLLKFADGSELSIWVTGGQALGVYASRFSARVEQLKKEIAKEKGICCDTLKAALGNHDNYPVLVRISVVDWRDKENWSYPGATGPGFYKIYDVRVKTGEERKIVYYPLDFCPFCHTDLREE